MFEPRLHSDASSLGHFLFAVIFFRFVFLCQRKRGGVVVGEGGGGLVLER